MRAVIEDLDWDAVVAMERAAGTRAATPRSAVSSARTAGWCWTATTASTTCRPGRPSRSPSRPRPRRRPATRPCGSRPGRSNSLDLAVRGHPGQLTRTPQRHPAPAVRRRDHRVRPARRVVERHPRRPRPSRRPGRRCRRRCRRTTPGHRRPRSRPAPPGHAPAGRSTMSSHAVRPPGQLPGRVECRPHRAVGGHREHRRIRPGDRHLDHLDAATSGDPPEPIVPGALNHAPPSRPPRSHRAPPRPAARTTPPRPARPDPGPPSRPTRSAWPPSRMTRSPDRAPPAPITLAVVPPDPITRTAVPPAPNTLAAGAPDPIVLAGVPDLAIRGRSRPATAWPAAPAASPRHRPARPARAGPTPPAPAR